MCTPLFAEQPTGIQKALSLSHSTWRTRQRIGRLSVGLVLWGADGVCRAGFLEEAVPSLAGRAARKRPCGKGFPGRGGSPSEDLGTDLAWPLWQCRVFGRPWVAWFWGLSLRAMYVGWLRATPVKPCFVSWVGSVLPGCSGDARHAGCDACSEGLRSVQPGAEDRVLWLRLRGPRQPPTP